MDYTRLQDLLAAGRWKDADKETLQSMLQVSGREKQGWLNVKSINKFPCDDLRIINSLWEKYSNGRFGFKVQKGIWLELGGKLDGKYQLKTATRFGQQVGWFSGGRYFSHEELDFSMNALPGHLPSRYGLQPKQVKGFILFLICCGLWSLGCFYLAYFIISIVYLHNSTIHLHGWLALTVLAVWTVGVSVLYYKFSRVFFWWVIYANIGNIQMELSCILSRVNNCNI